MYSKMQGRGGMRGRGCSDSTPFVEITTTSPFSMSRTKSRADDVEGAGLRAEDRRRRRARRAPAGGCRADRGAPISFLLVQRDERIGAFELRAARR